MDGIRYFLLMLGVVLFSYQLERKKNQEMRLVIMCVVACAYVFLGMYIAEMDVESLSYLWRVLALGVMVAGVCFCWKCHISIAVYNSIWALVLWQIVMEMDTALTMLIVDDHATGMVLQEIITMLLFGVVYVLVSQTIGKWMPIDRNRQIGPRQLSSALAIALCVEVLGFSQDILSIDAHTSEWAILFITQILAVVILYLQNELFKKSAMRQEMVLMNYIHNKEKEQYNLTKENINLINQKCHDLKHQIHALRKVSKEEFDRYLDEIEDSVRIYESIVKTGNDVLDMILTEKSIFCKERGIQVSCVADGSQMGFIDTIDLYAILGNAMDNAIEAVEKILDVKKRQIDVIICRQQNFLMIQIVNPIVEQLEYEDELPVTTKGDKRYHGYGLKSIRHFVKKYDGFLDIHVADGCFSLKILIPIQSKTTDEFAMNEIE